ncbi:hypothetical protein PVAP13_5NG164081 [Panicum virgatum]|uniref:CCHC-type domain-containing protein n=1 Tax=Panicum virgatum TaxID=38727 RepID=A0A8T0RN31_PANVG|nr:hypothetical protein PVAP13_5NG164081 [Panicum virgatum]
MAASKKREFDVLTSNGSNYLSWSLDAEILLSGKNLLKTIKPKSGESSSETEKAQALHFLRHHLSTTLKNEYMAERNPKVLWDSLHERFEKIESLCGRTLEDKDLINKTLSTFHPKLTYVSRQYKKDNYKTYVALSNALQQDQGEDETIMQNHLSRPTGTVAPHEAHATSFKKNDNKGKGTHKAPWKGKGKQFRKNKMQKSKKTLSGGEYGKQDQDCYRCGMRGHLSRICRTPKHIMDLYQELHGQKKKKQAQHEAHFVDSEKLEIERAMKTTEDNNKDMGESSKNPGDIDLDDDLMDEDGLLSEEDVHGDTK